MNIFEIGKGVLLFIGGIIYFKFFNQSLANNEMYDKEEEGVTKSEKGAFKFADKIRDILGFLSGIGLFIFGTMYVYNEFARYFKWSLLFVDK